MTTTWTCMFVMEHPPQDKDLRKKAKDVLMSFGIELYAGEYRTSHASWTGEVFISGGRAAKQSDHDNIQQALVDAGITFSQLRSEWRDTSGVYDKQEFYGEHPKHTAAVAVAIKSPWVRR